LTHRDAFVYRAGRSNSNAQKGIHTLMSKIRVATLGLAAVVVLAWAVPAFANHSKATVDTVTVTAGKPSPFAFTLSKKSVSKGIVTFKVTNKGAGLPHDFKISGRKTKMLQPGKSDTLRVTFLKTGTYPYVCTVPGHAAAGMKGVLTVK
jgi:uncharacterized cupredoxin-like copper-binding protein